MKKLILAFAVAGLMAGFTSCNENCVCKLAGIKVEEYTQEELDELGMKCSDIDGGLGWSCK